MNKKYDNTEPDMPDSPPKREQCHHEFIQDYAIIDVYSDDLCEKVIEYGRQGLFIDGFAGRYNVSIVAMCNWLSKPDEYPKFNAAIKISHSACIHYYNQELLHSIQCGDWQAVANIKSILAEIMKTTPKELRENLYNNLRVKTPEELEAEQKAQSHTILLGAMTGNDNS